VPEVLRYMKSFVHFLLELEELWLQTRKRSEREQRILDALTQIRGQVMSNVRIADLQRAYAHAKLQVPSRLRLILSEYNILSTRRMTSREELRQFWQQTKEQLRTGRLTRIRLHTMVRNVWRELKLHTSFAISFSYNLMPSRPPQSTMVTE
ncbi:MAG: hypothetical protein OXC69_04765, partial [Candidatus Tectomicrobia bacterium]|nr:hypothetical protein [Candidatus Tectomicrobia bacterium]